MTAYQGASSASARRQAPGEVAVGLGLVTPDGLDHTGEALDERALVPRFGERPQNSIGGPQELCRPLEVPEAERVHRQVDERHDRSAGVAGRVGEEQGVSGPLLGGGEVAEGVGLERSVGRGGDGEVTLLAEQRLGPPPPADRAGDVALTERDVGSHVGRDAECLGVAGAPRSESHASCDEVGGARRRPGRRRGRPRPRAAGSTGARRGRWPAGVDLADETGREAPREGFGAMRSSASSSSSAEGGDVAGPLRCRRFGEGCGHRQEGVLVRGRDHRSDEG